MLNIVMADDDAAFRRELLQQLGEIGTGDLFVAEAADAARACELIDELAPDVVLVDSIMPVQSGGRPTERGGATVLEHVATSGCGARVVMISGQDTQSAVDLLSSHKLNDYVAKDEPWKVITARVSEQLRIAGEDRRRAVASTGEEEPVVVSEAMRQVRERLGDVAGETTSVLLTGESGVGKEVAARLLHRLSPRRDGAFVAVNCATLLDELAGSELFGHVRGAFTGAATGRTGKFELASGGTLFLDEVTELSARNQAALLRVLEESSIQRVGGQQNLVVDVRLVAATNACLQTMVAEGYFRKDLYFRLAVYPVDIPPLRVRRDDIAPLAEHFLASLRRRMHRPAAGFAAEALERLARHGWPGNVRELRNVVERALITERTAQVTAATVDRCIGPDGAVGGATAPPTLDYETARVAFERSFWEYVLQHVEGNIAEASRVTGLPRATLYDKLKTAGLR